MEWLSFLFYIEEKSVEMRNWVNFRAKAACEKTHRQKHKFFCNRKTEKGIRRSFVSVVMPPDLILFHEKNRLQKPSTIVFLHPESDGEQPYISHSCFKVFQLLRKLWGWLIQGFVRSVITLNFQMERQA